MELLGWHIYATILSFLRRMGGGVHRMTPNDVTEEQVATWTLALVKAGDALAEAVEQVERAARRECMPLPKPLWDAVCRSAGVARAWRAARTARVQEEESRKCRQGV
jgi:hypothetical protein